MVEMTKEINQDHAVRCLLDLLSGSGIPVANSFEKIMAAVDFKYFLTITEEDLDSLGLTDDEVYKLMYIMPFREAAVRLKWHGLSGKVIDRVITEGIHSTWFLYNRAGFSDFLMHKSTQGLLQHPNLLASTVDTVLRLAPSMLVDYMFTAGLVPWSSMVGLLSSHDGRTKVLSSAKLNLDQLQYILQINEGIPDMQAMECLAGNQNMDADCYDYLFDLVVARTPAIGTDGLERGRRIYGGLLAVLMGYIDKLDSGSDEIHKLNKILSGELFEGYDLADYFHLLATLTSNPEVSQDNIARMDRRLFGSLFNLYHLWESREFDLTNQAVMAQINYTLSSGMEGLQYTPRLVYKWRSIIGHTTRPFDLDILPPVLLAAAIRNFDPGNKYFPESDIFVSFVRVLFNHANKNDLLIPLVNALAVAVSSRYIYSNAKKEITEAIISLAVSPEAMSAGLAQALFKINLPHVREYLAANPGIPSEILGKWYLSSKGARILKHLSSNPSLPDHIRTFNGVLAD